MSPETAINALDRALVHCGQDVILRRVVGTQPDVTNVDVTVRAMVKTWRLREEDVAAGVKQAVVLATISPTQIAASQWPGGVMTVTGVDPSVPRRGDHLITGGRLQTIEAVESITVNGVNVRFNMQLLG